MLTLEELLILFVVLDETTADIDVFGVPAQVTKTTLLRITVNLHLHTLRILDMLAARSVAFLTLDTGFSPGAHKAG